VPGRRRSTRAGETLNAVTGTASRDFHVPGKYDPPRVGDRKPKELIMSKGNKVRKKEVKKPKKDKKAKK
jgi:hypothetical protein